MFGKNTTQSDSCSDSKYRTFVPVLFHYN